MLHVVKIQTAIGMTRKAYVFHKTVVILVILVLPTIIVKNTEIARVFSEPPQ